jgi:hypothetical protein
LAAKDIPQTTVAIKRNCNAEIFKKWADCPVDSVVKKISGPTRNNPSVRYRLLGYRHMPMTTGSAVSNQTNDKLPLSIVIT